MFLSKGTRRKSIPGSILSESKGQAILEEIPIIWAIFNLITDIIRPILFHLPGCLERLTQFWDDARIAPVSQNEGAFRALTEIPFIVDFPQVVMPIPPQSDVCIWS